MIETLQASSQTEEKRPLAAAASSHASLLGHEPLLRQEPLSARFARICALHPDRTAMTCGSASKTYQELNAASSRIAAELLPFSSRPGPIAAVYLDRSVELITAMLGVIQAGSAYLPIDSTYPIARVLETLADAQPYAIVTTRQLAERLGALDIPYVFIEEVASSPASVLPDLDLDPNSLAYVIYTSGSTGTPKGVQVSHHNVLRLLDQTEPWFHFDQHDVWTMFHSCAFDFSVWEMWACLLTGGHLIVVPFAVSRAPEEFCALLAQQRVTILNQTPSAFSMLIQAEGRGAALPLALRCVILGGEALNLRSLAPWFERHGDATPQVVNMYGITETTVHVTYRRILAADAERETDSLIGEPIPDLQIHLLDEHLRPVPEGETGEICIGGPGVALGYLRRPELNAERFLSDPFAPAGCRLYRSGDLARRRADGELVYLGRADRQVKINGFRIELGEIEAALTGVPGVAQSCVVSHADADGTQRLAAYFVASDPADAPENKTLSNFLAIRLPVHMRPAFYVPLAALPMTGNGKIDRAALPSPLAYSAKAIHISSSSISRSSMEALVARIWRQVLGTDATAPDDNFFDVGGTSLLLIAVRTALQQELNRTLPITWFFECTTIQSLARRLEEDAAPPSSATTSVQNNTQENARRQREAFARMKAAKIGTGRGTR